MSERQLVEELLAAVARIEAELSVIRSHLALFYDDARFVRRYIEADPHRGLGRGGIDEPAA